MKQWDIFIAFFRTGMLGYGGGPASIPLLHREAVVTYQWLTDEEFSDVLALGNTLPGPIITKLAGFIGYRIGGFLGLVNAVAASILPTIILMIILFTFLSSIQEQPWVQGMLRGVLPVVGVMMALLTCQFFWKGKQTAGWLSVLVLTGLGILLIGVLNIHPGFIIGAVLIYALVKKNKSSEEAAS
ncbi:chromate transporter [Alteribacillus sp. HJP-4]|uniref:chromate transporter n=1 Tax=Alteribacillus sp. HJP-4 TaxID=2775394 RepID=UPI0035CD112D